MGKSSTSHWKRWSHSKLFYCIRFLTQGLSTQFRRVKLFKTFSMHLVRWECSIGAKEIVGLDSRNRQNLNFLDYGLSPPPPSPSVSWKIFPARFRNIAVTPCRCTHAPFAVPAASSRAHLRQFRACCNPAFQENGVPSTCYLCHFSGFFPCSGTGELPLKKVWISFDLDVSLHASGITQVKCDW